MTTEDQCKLIRESAIVSTVKSASRVNKSQLATSLAGQKVRTLNRYKGKLEIPQIILSWVIWFKLGSRKHYP